MVMQPSHKACYCLATISVDLADVRVRGCPTWLRGYVVMMRQWPFLQHGSARSLVITEHTGRGCDLN